MDEKRGKGKVSELDEIESKSQKLRRDRTETNKSK